MIRAKLGREDQLISELIPEPDSTGGENQTKKINNSTL
jgi:hypothetical protein